jgi:hypothetical protein
MDTKTLFRLRHFAATREVEAGRRELVAYLNGCPAEADMWKAEVRKCEKAREDAEHELTARGFGKDFPWSAND